MSVCAKTLSWVFSNSAAKVARGQNYSRQTLSSRITRRHGRFDVFINHSGKDTKRNIAALLYDRFVDLKLHPFLDYKTMKPGVELQETIESAIRDCKVGVVIFSPHYCLSDNCLHELSLMMEWEKKIIPIFYDVNPSDLVLLLDGTSHSTKQLHRFTSALELAKGRVGISFDSCNGDWSDLLKRTSDRVVEILTELAAKEKVKVARGQNYSRQILSSRITRRHRCFDVFINHSGKDTKRNIAALLYDRFVDLKLHPFLDYKTMKPGVELQETIESAIRDCKVGVVIFSPHYCLSDNCLHELSLMMEWEKKIIPIFYDVNPSDLVLLLDGTSHSTKQLHRFTSALELAKGRVGISFDSCNGDWSDLLKTTSDRVVEILTELAAKEKGYRLSQKKTNPF